MYNNLFYLNLQKNKEKLILFEQGLKDAKIQLFDPETLSKLRRVYYAFYSGIIYLYGEPTSFSTIGNKIEILSYVFEDYTIVHGNIDSIKNINFSEYNYEHLDYNTWMEVKRGNKTYVYDLFSMMRFDKDLYYELENPEILKKVTKEYIDAHPARSDTDFTKPNSLWMLVGFIPEFEKKLANHPYKNILLQELVRYKREINYDEILLNWQKEEIEIHKKS